MEILRVFITVASFYFVSVSMTLAQSSCELSSIKPKDITNTIGHSNDNKAVVNASAYLQYYASDERINFVNSSQFMPVEFKNYELELDDLSGNSFMMVLDADCVQIFLELVRNGQDWAVDTADVILTVSNKGSFVCRIENIGIIQKAGKHCACDLNDRPLVCKSWNHVDKKYTDIIGIVFARLEFEVFGSPARTMEDKFTTNITSC